VTAEVAILNRNAVALAADSAVTIGKKRVWKHSSKLFLLSDYNDIAVMIHNSADYRGIPWQIIIKQFRREIRDTKFSRVTDASEKFIEYLSKFPLPTKHTEPEKDGSELSVYSMIFSSLAECKKCIEDEGITTRMGKRKCFTDSAKRLAKKQNPLAFLFL